MAYGSVVLLIGQTAVGKTALLENLSSYPIEIISADSRQIYKNFDISTAYPSNEFQNRVPHHLIATHDFTTQYTVADFVHSAEECINSIWKRGNWPIVSGGTAYYLYHLWKGLPNTPARDKSIREDLQQLEKKHGLKHLYDTLCSMDSEYAESISCTDTQRIIRALEIIKITGKPVSSFQTSRTHSEENKQYALIGLTRSKEVLHQQIEDRVDSMRIQGLAEEVYNLYQQGLRLTHSASHTIGIQEFLQNLNVTNLWDSGIFQLPNTLWLDEIRPQIIKNTKQYAKRQATFFKRFSSTRWFAAESEQHQACSTIIEAFSQ